MGPQLTVLIIEVSSICVHNSRFDCNIHVVYTYIYKTTTPETNPPKTRIVNIIKSYIKWTFCKMMKCLQYKLQYKVWLFQPCTSLYCYNAVHVSIIVICWYLFF